jgi:hypothetical protein
MRHIRWKIVTTDSILPESAKITDEQELSGTPSINIGTGTERLFIALVHALCRINFG